MIVAFTFNFIKCRSRHVHVYQSQIAAFKLVIFYAALYMDLKKEARIYKINEILLATSLFIIHSVHCNLNINLIFLLVAAT